MNIIEQAIVKGCCDILWGDAWAYHVDQVLCTNLSGQNICNLMPEPTPDAWAAAGRVIGNVEAESLVGGKKNGMFFLFRECLKIDGIDPDNLDRAEELKLAERFGDCLAHMSLGSGVSWEDDHAHCPGLEVQSGENDLYYEAEQACGCGLTEESE